MCLDGGLRKRIFTRAIAPTGGRQSETDQQCFEPLDRNVRFPCTRDESPAASGVPLTPSQLSHTPEGELPTIKKYPLGRPDCEKKTLGKLVFSVSLVSPQNTDYQLPRVVTILQRGYTCETCLEENYL
jgi:hypothetical protein